MNIIIYSLISIVLLTNCIANPVVANNYEDTAKIELLFIVKYIKSEIESSLRNKALKNEGKNYEVLIDFDKECFFMPIVDKDMKLVEIITKWNPFDQSSIYFLPTINSKIYLEKLCPEKSTSIELIDWPKGDCCDYYTIPGDEGHLYEIYHIIGYEYKFELENNESNKIKLDLSDEIDKNRKRFDVHFIYRIYSLRCNEEMQGVMKWIYKK